MIELEEAWKEGRLVEAFVSGTAVSLFFFFLIALVIGGWGVRLEVLVELWEVVIDMGAIVFYHAMLGYQFQRKRVGYPDG